VVVKVDDGTFAPKGLSLREVHFAVTLGEIIAKSPSIWGELHPRQQHVPEARK
jgi:hypothetical protein